MPQLTRSARMNELNFRYASQALVVLMLTSASFTLLSLIQRLMPTWGPVYLPVLCFFIALERFLTFHRFKDLSIFSREWFAAVLSEWVVIAIVLKLFVGFSHGVGAFVWEASHWLFDFGRYFLNAEFVILLALLFIAWLVTGSFASLLDEMDLARSMMLEIMPAIDRGKAPARERLMGLIFSFGTVLVVFTALVRLDLRGFMAHTEKLNFESMPALAGGGASTLLYFMLAIALLSQTRFIDLHTRWSVQHIPVSHMLGKSWALYSLIFLGLIATLVSFLPTSYSLQTLNLISNVLNSLAAMLFYIAQLIMSLLILLISLPMLLFGKSPQAITIPPTATPLPTQVPSAGESALQPGWLGVARAAIFWTIFLSILFFSLMHYLRQHEGVLAGLKRITAHARLSRLLNWLRAKYNRARVVLTVALQSAVERLRRPSTAAGGRTPGAFLSLRGLDARQKITFYYLALVRRGGENGLPRRPAQTPYEYAAGLDSALPEAEQDVNALTEAFISARYSPHPVLPEDVGPVKSTWERLKKKLRSLRR